MLEAIEPEDAAAAKAVDGPPIIFINYGQLDDEKSYRTKPLLASSKTRRLHAAFSRRIGTPSVHLPLRY
jgi:hypothetical protein